MIALRPRDQHVWDPRPLPHETETKTNYCEIETETKKVVLRQCWSRDLNIPAHHTGNDIALGCLQITSQYFLYTLDAYCTC